MLEFIVEKVRRNISSATTSSSTGAACPSPRRPDGGSHSHLSHAKATATYHRMVTIIFCDIVGFTDMCKTVEPIVVMEFLNQLYQRFDELSDIYDVYKVRSLLMACKC